MQQIDFFSLFTCRRVSFAGGRQKSRRLPKVKHEDHPLFRTYQTYDFSPHGDHLYRLDFSQPTLMVNPSIVDLTLRAKWCIRRTTSETTTRRCANRLYGYSVFLDHEDDFVLLQLAGLVADKIQKNSAREQYIRRASRWKRKNQEVSDKELLQHLARRYHLDLREERELFKESMLEAAR